MKKTRTMRMAAVLFALVLITSCFVGNTFAKYVASGEATDTARVAKFGVTIVADNTTDGMFKKEYAKEDSEYNGTLSVVSSTEDKVLAPGTEGNVGGFSITGTPEVAVRIKYTVDTFNLTGWTVAGTSDNEFYCPIIFKIGTETVDGLTFTDADSLVAAVKAKIEKTVDVDAKTSLASSNDISITWEWPFSTSAANDVKDTALGDAGTASISLKISCTVTQID